MSKVSKNTNPIVVMKLVMKEPSENRKSRQLFPTPEFRSRLEFDSIALRQIAPHWCLKKLFEYWMNFLMQKLDSKWWDWFYFTEKFQNLNIRGDEKAATRADNKTDNIKHKFERLKQEVESTITTAKSPHPLKEEVLPANEIIQLIRGIEGLSIFRGQPLADFPSIEATHKSTNEILEEVLDMLKKFVDSENYAIEVPSRGKQNQEFDEESESMKLMPTSTFLRKLTDKPNDIFTVTISVLLEIFKLCNANIHANIRDIYYTNTTLYKNQQRISSVIDDLCCILRCHRYCLHLFATDKGVVLGNMKYIYNGKEVDCSSDEFGQPIPARTDLLTSMSTDDEDLAFIIVVEKHSVFMRLAQDLFWKKFKCIMITASGMQDVGSRYFLRMAETTFKRPVYALFDSNPYGARILCTYRYGSDNMSYDSKSLAT
ncbi:DNA topoisomerase 6 subunit A-like [Rosa rugosa]|uniref:DNA topoisomerase 6 subunit A-like n=1 Tax=Rosa rugosa TaxID=74645 RepID=UPI002B410B81|nr:DNA topoisomerase 6 subunit A-like [Rosa rugosa]